MTDLPPQRVCPWCPPNGLCAFCHWMGPATRWAIEVGTRGVPVLDESERTQ